MTGLLQFLKDSYGLSDPRIESVLETRGKRSAYIILVGDKRSVLKILTSSNFVEDRMLAQQRLNSLGFPCPKLFLNKDGQIISMFNNKELFLMEYIDGAESYPSSKNFSELGTLAAQFHAIDASRFSLPKRQIGLEIDQILMMLRKSRGYTLPEKSEVIKVLRNLPDFDNVDQTLLHYDLSFFNVIKTVGRPVLIDFDNLSIGPYVLDLGHLVAFSCCLIPWDFAKYPQLENREELTFYPDWVEHFLSAYNSVKKIHKKDVPYIYQATLFSCLLNIFDKESGQSIRWNFRRYLEIRNKQQEIEKILGDSL